MSYRKENWRNTGEVIVQRNDKGQFVKSVVFPTIIKKQKEKYLYKQVKQEIQEKKEQEQYDEYEYFIGFDYETPTVSSGGKQIAKGQKGIHDFKTEFIIRSPSPLSDSEIKSMILDEYSDYHNVLKNRQAFKNIILQAKRKKSKKVDLEFEPSDLSENIER
jgi:hypothetical protein